MVPSMKLGLLLLAGLISCSADRIVGGESTAIENYPSLVQLERNILIWQQYCAANILTSRWLLTAAHCFGLVLPRNARIRAGSTFRNVGGEVHYVDTLIVHPDYSRVVMYEADIAVFQIATPLVYTPGVQPGTIVAYGDIVPDNYPVVHAGWGTTRYGGSSSFILQDVTINVINNELCRQRYFELSGQERVTTNMICAGILDVGGRDACQGDSGGPLYSGEVIVGVVSWGEGCANGTYPGVSTSVASYTNWIRDNAR